MDTRSQRILVVAEVAEGHDGSLGTAHALVDAAAAAGADVIQFRLPPTPDEAGPEAAEGGRFGRQDATLRDYWTRVAFSEEQWVGLRSHALKAGMDFMTAPLTTGSFGMLHRVGVGGWAVAPEVVGDEALLEAMAATHLPVHVDTGLSSLAEIDAAVAALRRWDVELTLLQGTAVLPTPAERLGLELIPAFRERWRCGVGLADRSGTIWPSLAAVTLGADVVRVRLALSRHAFAPDLAASVTPEELARLVEGARYLAWARAHPMDKDEVARELAPVRDLGPFRPPLR